VQKGAQERAGAIAQVLQVP